MTATPDPSFHAKLMSWESFAASPILSVDSSHTVFRRLRPIQKLQLGDTIAIQALYRVHVRVSDTIQYQGGPAGFSI